VIQTGQVAVQRTKDSGATSMLPWLLPFLLYMAFIALDTPLRWASSWFVSDAVAQELLPLWIYPVKTAVVLIALVWFWPAYKELHNRLVKTWQECLVISGVGIAVYLAWVRMDWSWAMQGRPDGYNPFLAGDQTGVLLGGIRLFGAVVVVPLMEELFWRSFVTRYLINPKFTTVAIGAFTPFSCIATVILFGFEHHLWLAGIMAGIAYHGVLYYTRRLWPCVLAHALTNLLLGLHVLFTQEWHWW
jgi:uncharacterized protein